MELGSTIGWMALGCLSGLTGKDMKENTIMIRSKGKVVCTTKTDLIIRAPGLMGSNTELVK